jgi:hypothetical protein
MRNQCKHRINSVTPVLEDTYTHTCAYLRNTIVLDLMFLEFHGINIRSVLYCLADQTVSYNLFAKKKTRIGDFHNTFL